MMTALRDALATDLATATSEPETEPALNWAQEHEPALYNAPKLRPVKSSAINPGNIIITPEGDRQSVLSSKREGLNVKLTLTSNVNPSEKQTMTVPAYRRISIEEPAAGAQRGNNPPSEPEPENHHEVAVTNHTNGPGLD